MRRDDGMGELMTRVCFALVAALFCSACGNEVPSPPALPRSLDAPSARPAQHAAEPSVAAPETVPGAAAAAPSDLTPAEGKQAHRGAIERPVAAVQAAPARPQAQAAGIAADAPLRAEPNDAQVLLLRAEGLACTRMPCSRERPCCNGCMGSRWRPVPDASVLQRPDGTVLTLTGKALPKCSWEGGQCGCEYDLRVVGEAQGDQFVVTDVSQVRRVHPIVRDAPPSFSTAWLQTWAQARERSLDTCFEHRKRQNPALAPGALVVRIVVTPEGRVEDPHVTSDSLGDAALTDCITRTLRRWRANPAPAAAQAFEVHVPLGTETKRVTVVAL